MDFLKQLLARLASYILFFALIFFISTCLLTGEIPPKIESLRIQLRTLSELKKNYTAVMKRASEQLAQQNENLNSPNSKPLATPLPLDGNNGALTDLRYQQARINTRLEELIEQNKQIIKLLKDSNQKPTITQ